MHNDCKKVESQGDDLSCLFGWEGNDKHQRSRVSNMKSAEAKRRTIFLNGVEIESIEPSGKLSKDMVAARKFLAAQGIGGPQERLTLRAKIARARGGRDSSRASLPEHLLASLQRGHSAI